MNSELKHQSGTGLRALSLMLVLFVLTLPTSAQDEQQTARISDLESYQDLPVQDGSEEEHWYQIRHGDQWIGWSNMQTAILQTFQDDGSEPMNIFRHHHSAQVSPHLVREQLKGKLREKIKEENEDRTLTRTELDKLVKNRVDTRMEQLKTVVERRSFSSTIYRNQNRTLREAKYGYSSDNQDDFTLYVEPARLGSGRYTILMPGEVPKEVTVSRDRPITNHFLAAQLMAGDSFNSDSYRFFLLVGTADDPLVRANATLTADQTETLKIADRSYETRKAKVVLNYAGGKTLEENWWIDQDGILRKIVQLPVEEGGTPITYVYSSREDARKGYEFVFARNGRRNPFKPIWPSQRTESAKEDGGACSDYDGEVVLNQARELVFERASSLNQIQNRQSRIQVQRTLIQKFNTLKGQVMSCGDDSAKKEINKYEKELQNVIDISSMVLSIAEDKLEAAELAFKRRAFDEVRSLSEEIAGWKGELPSEPSESVTEKFDQIVSSANRLAERAQIRKQFLNEAPEVRGVVASRNERRRDVRMGIDVFGDGMSTSMNVNIPDVRSIAIIQSQQSGGRDRAKQPGETMEVEGLGEITVEAVHKDGVIFKYKGESIKVPLLKVEEAVGQG
jgi:hypothetical protein